MDAKNRKRAISAGRNKTIHSKTESDFASRGNPKTVIPDITKAAITENIKCPLVILCISLILLLKNDNAFIINNP